MAEKREHKRIDCAEKCLLYHDNSRYCGAIMNISISGVLIQLPTQTSGAILPGDTCSFILSTNEKTAFCRYKGRIARVSPPEIGVEILEHEF